MNRLAGTSLVALAAAALLASLSLVAWRQARAMEVLEGVDSLQRELTLGQAEKADLLQRVHLLESRGRVTKAAEERLGMKLPTGSEMVLIPGVGS